MLALVYLKVEEAGCLRERSICLVIPGCMNAWRAPTEDWLLVVIRVEPLHTRWSFAVTHDKWKGLAQCAITHKEFRQDYEITGSTCSQSSTATWMGNIVSRA